MKKSDASGAAYLNMSLVSHDDGKYCQFKYLALLLMSIVTHSKTQPAGPKK